MSEPEARRRGPYAKTAGRRQQIVDEAYRVFATRGYHGSSLREIAAAAGIGQSTLQHHFGSKEELLIAVLARRDDLGGDRSGAEPSSEATPVTTPAAAPFADRLVAQAERNEANPGLVALYSVLSAEAVTERHPGREYFLDRYASLRAEFTAELTALHTAGRLREGVDPALAAATVVALWDGIQLQWLYDPERIHAAAALRAYLDLIVLTER